MPLTRPMNGALATTCSALRYNMHHVLVDGRLPYNLLVSAPNLEGILSSNAFFRPTQPHIVFRQFFWIRQQFLFQVLDLLLCLLHVGVFLQLGSVITLPFATLTILLLGTYLKQHDQ